jgi:dihydrofolate reductase
MRKVIANLFASLDGFAVDRDGEMRWVTDDYGEETEKFVQDAHYSMDVMLLECVTYQEFVSYWPSASVEEEPLADRMNSIPKLVESLLQDGLLDELKLAIHPVVAGSEKRLFKDGRAPKRLRLVDSKTTGTGVSILTFRPAGKVESGSFAVER